MLRHNLRFRWNHTGAAQRDVERVFIRIIAHDLKGSTAYSATIPARCGKRRCPMLQGVIGKGKMLDFYGVCNPSVLQRVR